VSAEGWIDFAKKIEEAGADAIEVNVFVLPVDKYKLSADYEEIYFEIARQLVSKIKIPFSLKIGSNFTNLTALADNLEAIGTNGLVLFNRFYEPDIDIDTLSLVSSDILSFPSEIRKSLRWVGMLSDVKSKLDIAASTGVHDAEAAIKLLLAGAQAIQICSIVYTEGLEVIAEIKEEIVSWMKEKKFESIEDFRYKLNYKKANKSVLYERSQFMKYFSDASEMQY
jgi:dihydroorotate dehydrogenase (fumarate)